MTVVSKIHIFNNVDGASDYLELNLYFVQYLKNIVKSIHTQLNREPFTNNLLFPTADTTINGVSYTGSATPVTAIADTSLHTFTTSIVNETDVFYDACAVAFQTLKNQKSKMAPNIDFITQTFHTAQTWFLKNVVNYFSIFAFITNMSVFPTLQDATQVISSELQTLFTNKQIVLSDAANLLDTNIRNMTVASRPHF